MDGCMRKLEAPEGYVYTNGETSGTVVFLGKHDSADNWRLIPEAEAAEAETADYETALAEFGVNV